jgi:hypothetical protein
MTYEEIITWYKVKTRPLTEEEKREYIEQFGYEFNYVFDCKMPDDGDEILIVTKYGVDTDVCGIDEGYFLENHGDWEDVIAWAAMPKYKVGEQNG